MNSFDKITKEHDFLIGIDSDGCAFDTMEIKHKECFIPNIIKYFNLQGISKYAREAGEFVNLYSVDRGINRWPALIKVLDYLVNREDVIKRDFKIQGFSLLRGWVASETKWSNNTLENYINEFKEKNNEVPLELINALDWSNAVNKSIEDMVYGIPPFPFVRESLEKLIPVADMLVVSQTPVAALEREWEEHNIDKYVKLIAGQEMGTKSEHLKFTMAKGYEPEKTLMIGDALGDKKAAKSNNALFYPIIPGKEDLSWERFYTEAIDKFVSGNYKGVYEDSLIAEFNKYLPEKPIWK